MEDKVEIPVPQTQKAKIPFLNLILRKLQGAKGIGLLLLIIFIIIVGIILFPGGKEDKKI